MSKSPFALPLCGVGGGGLGTVQKVGIGDMLGSSTLMRCHPAQKEAKMFNTYFNSKIQEDSRLVPYRSCIGPILMLRPETVNSSSSSLDPLLFCLVDKALAREPTNLLPAAVASPP